MIEKITEDDIWSRLEHLKRGQKAIHDSVRFLWNAMTFFNLSDTERADILKSELRMGFLASRMAQYGLIFSPTLVREWQDAFGITQEDVRRILIKNVHGLALPVSVVADHVQAVADYFRPCGYGRSSFIQAFLRYPTLFGQPAETIIGHIETVSRHFAADGLTQKEYVGIALDNPSLFFADAQKVITRTEQILSWFQERGIKRSVGMQRMKPHPSLFYVKVETILGNVEESANWLYRHGVSREAYRRVVGKQPALFFADADTIQKRIETVATHFQKEGMTTRAYAAIAISVPRLLLGNPNRVVHHIEAVSHHFANEGMTVGRYLQAAMKQKSLFSQNPQTIIHHIESVLSVIQAVGGERRAYVQAALQQPSLFCLDTETVVRHARTVIQAGLRLNIWKNEAAAWAWLCRRPVVLCLSDDNLRYRALLGEMQMKSGQVVFKDIFSISRGNVLQRMCLLNGVVLSELYADIDGRQRSKAIWQKSPRYREEIAFRYIRRQHSIHQNG